MGGVVAALLVVAALGLAIREGRSRLQNVAAINPFSDYVVQCS
jgi:hypothetical protein